MQVCNSEIKARSTHTRVKSIWKTYHKHNNKRLEPTMVTLTRQGSKYKVHDSKTETSSSTMYLVFPSMTYLTVMGMLIRLPVSRSYSPALFLHDLPDGDGDADTFASFTFILPSIVPPWPTWRWWGCWYVCQFHVHTPQHCSSMTYLTVMGTLIRLPVSRSYSPALFLHDLPDGDGDADTFASFPFILPSIVHPWPTWRWWGCWYVCQFHVHTPQHCSSMTYLTVMGMLIRLPVSRSYSPALFLHDLPDGDGDADTFASFTFILPSIVPPWPTWRWWGCWYVCQFHVHTPQHCSSSAHSGSSISQQPLGTGVGRTSCNGNNHVGGPAVTSTSQNSEENWFQISEVSSSVQVPSLFHLENPQSLWLFYYTAGIAQSNAWLMIKSSGFKSWQKRCENFVLQGQLFQHSYFSVSPPPCYRSSM